MWVDTHGTPITTSISKDIKVRRLEKYLKDRDGYRAQRGAPAIWENTKVAFATRQYELKDSARGERARRVRVIWDKGWHGGNRAKGDCEEEETKCVLCGEVDGQRHWMVECEYDACTRIRSMTKDRMNEIAEDLAGREKPYRLAKTIVEWAWSKDEACRIWTGLWSSRLMEELEETLQFGVMSKKEVDELQAVAMSLGRILASATLMQWELKVHGTKTVDKKVEDFATKVSAMKLLERANYKRRRNEKKKLADKVATDNLAGKGRTSEQAKLAYHIAKWVDGVDGNLSQAEFNTKYSFLLNVITPKVASNGGEKSTQSSSLVRGRMC